MYVRKPVVDGQFYDADPERLTKQIHTYIAEGNKENFDTVYGIISPHAGYMYSGPVAGSAYSALAGRAYDTVLIIAPSHRYRIGGGAVTTEGVYRTPLGDVPIDTELASLLLDGTLIMSAPEVDEVEHSLEVQVPFVQTVLPGLPIVPIIIGTTEYDVCIHIGERIANKITQYHRRVLIIVSTDLSHYLSYQKAVETDSLFCKALETCNTELIRRSVEEEGASACGYGPVLAGVAACRDLGAERCRVVDYRNSGDTAGPKSEVVGYCAAVLSK